MSQHYSSLAFHPRHKTTQCRIPLTSVIKHEATSVCRAVLNDKDDIEYATEIYKQTHQECNRNCASKPEPRICKYLFVVEEYSSMSKACYNCPDNLRDCIRKDCVPIDGVQKLIYTVNRQLPGPTIEVCHNDEIRVTVKNKLQSESTTIHWHGLKQEGTPYMDGVPFVTQCPIPPSTQFEYIFTATSHGTFFWHSHVGTQRADGFYGALIVHPSDYENKMNNLYDHDHHHMIVSDWMHLDGDSAIVKEYHDRIGINPVTLLVNGKGRFFYDGSKSFANTPVEIFKVKRGHKYRFRMINAAAEDCPIRVSVDNHKLLVISLDGQDVEEVNVDAIDIWSGERVDFVLNANQKPRNYWIRLRGFGLCSPTNNSVGAFQVARLWYISAPNRDPPSQVGYNIPKTLSTTRVLNPFQRGTESANCTSVNIPLLKSKAENDLSLKEKPDQQIYVSFDMYPIDNPDFHRKDLYGFNQVLESRRIGTLQLNHISLKLQSFPLLSQRDMITSSTFCNESTTKSNYCLTKHCACTHVLQIELNSVVELVLVDEGRYATINHPLHLHGHFFRVVSSVNLPNSTTVEQVKELDRLNMIKRNLDRAPIKDTIKAPGGGYTIVRFLADNPGYWFFHCHFEQHMMIGMALVFKVGEHEDFTPVPQGFPTCGDY
ncbi:hypothetical protein QAD02_019237 [Eretmocerus hayati]|uniref:Uncharacterized protein n=1 Tax=Eretmocerus hayati TaxID=131215 RepID=A0ACC2PNT6_9HYME|nr:hypothetical protein QAD02_019237 [Eretmocerus hayati]